MNPIGGGAEDVLGRAAAWRAAGRGVALATVVSTWGSAPRPAGSVLAVNDGAAFLGSVSGGCVESAVVEEAVASIRDGDTRLLKFGVTSEMAWDVGLACGGEIEVFVARVDDSGWLEDLVEARDAKRAIVLVSDLETGEHALLAPGALDGDAALHDAAREAISSDRAREVSIDGRRILVNPFLPPLRMIVVGAVHIAQSLSRIAALAGFDVTVVDPRAAWASPERFPDVVLDSRWPGEAVTALAPDARTAVVTLSHDPKLDDPALGAALRSDAFYVGALGSRRTHAKRLERLRGEGFSDEALARIRGPVGLPLGATTPAEIALSIAAEAIARIRRRA